MPTLRRTPQRVKRAQQQRKKGKEEPAVVVAVPIPVAVVPVTASAPTHMDDETSTATADAAVVAAITAAVDSGTGDDGGGGGGGEKDDDDDDAPCAAAPAPGGQPGITQWNGDPRLQRGEAGKLRNISCGCGQPPEDLFPTYECLECGDELSGYDCGKCGAYFDDHFDPTHPSSRCQFKSPLHFGSVTRNKRCCGPKCVGKAHATLRRLRTFTDGPFQHLLKLADTHARMCADNAFQRHQHAVTLEWDPAGDIPNLPSEAESKAFMASTDKDVDSFPAIKQWLHVLQSLLLSVPFYWVERADGTTGDFKDIGTMRQFEWDARMATVAVEAEVSSPPPPPSRRLPPVPGFHDDDDDRAVKRSKDEEQQVDAAAAAAAAASSGKRKKKKKKNPRRRPSRRQGRVRQPRPRVAGSSVKRRSGTRDHVRPDGTSDETAVHLIRPAEVLAYEWRGLALAFLAATSKNIALRKCVDRMMSTYTHATTGKLAVMLNQIFQHFLDQFIAGHSHTRPIKPGRAHRKWKQFAAAGAILRGQLWKVLHSLTRYFESANWRLFGDEPVAVFADPANGNKPLETVHEPDSPQLFFMVYAKGQEAVPLTIVRNTAMVLPEGTKLRENTLDVLRRLQCLLEQYRLQRHMFMSMMHTCNSSAAPTPVPVATPAAAAAAAAASGGAEEEEEDATGGDDDLQESKTADGANSSTALLAPRTPLSASKLKAHCPSTSLFGHDFRSQPNTPGSVGSAFGAGALSLWTPSSTSSLTVGGAHTWSVPTSPWDQKDTAGLLGSFTPAASMANRRSTAAVF